MSKQLTTRQIETVTRELGKTVDSVVDAWKVGEPAPTWQVEQEWQRNNPSPRDLHAQAERKVRARYQKQANEFLLRAKLGEIPDGALYQELSLLLNKLNEERMDYLIGADHEC